MKLTIEEVEADLLASQRDIVFLTNIVNNINDFISNPCGENRHFLRADKLKWDSMLAQAIRLHVKIEEKLAELSHICEP